MLLTLVTSFALFLLILCSFLLYAVSQEALLPVGSLSATEASALRRSIAHALLPFSLETLFGIITLSALLFRFGERGLKRVFGELSEAATTLHSPHPPSFPRDSEKGDRENPLLNTFALLGEKIRRENESIRRATEETKEIVEATARDIESFVWESEEMLRSLKCLDLSSQEAPALIASARDFLSGEQQLITALFTLVRLQAQSLVPESAERFSPEESLSAALMALGVFARRKGVKVQQSLQAENFLMKGSESTMDALLTAGLQGALVAAGNHGEVEIVATTRGRTCLLQMKASVAEKSSLKTPLGFLVARALGSYAAVDCHFEKSASSSALPSGLRAEGQSGSEGAGLPGASRTTSQHLFFEIRAEMPRD